MTVDPKPAGSNKILVGVAWPYSNGEQHIGHIAGAYLPPDIFARYQRIIGNDVVMVSGSDTHGTPVAIKADEEGVTPAEIVNRFHPLFIECYLKLGITFDLFTHTDTQNHWDVTQAMFLRHREAGVIYTEKQKQLVDPIGDRFLPDRYVEGICPKCGYDGARGDQCDNCGSTYDAIELINPRSRITGNKNLEIRETEHFFFDLGKLNEPLIAWFNGAGKTHWRTHVANLTRSQLEERKLRGRPITRDLTWGIPIPLPGYDTKRFYVWYDAVIGYLSGTKEWAQITGNPEAWRTFWDPKTNANARLYNFIGKDNIAFHTIIWPAMLLAHGDLNVPYDVPANNYITMYGSKASKSRANVIPIRKALDRYQADAWRYALTAMAPESDDVDFTWDDFQDRVNSELLNKWGNLVNRILSFSFKRFNGQIPTPGVLDAADEELLAQIRNGFAGVGALFEAVKLRAAAIELIRLTELVNNYITTKAPFKLIKTDEAAAATVTWVALQCVAWLNTIWSPILPNSAQLVHEMIGRTGNLFGRQFTETVADARGEHLVLRYDHAGACARWEAEPLVGGTPIPEPKALFVKLEEGVAEREAALEAGS